jgi:hypothetical protein
MTSEAAVQDHITAEEFTALFQKTIVEGGYIHVSKQLFSLDETRLFWKCTPSFTFISTEDKTAPWFNPFTWCDSMFSHGQTVPSPILTNTG